MYRIKAKAKLYFDDNGGSVSASEESLSDAVAKVKTIFINSNSSRLIVPTLLQAAISP